MEVAGTGFNDWDRGQPLASCLFAILTPQATRTPPSMLGHPGGAPGEQSSYVQAPNACIYSYAQEWQIELSPQGRSGGAKLLHKFSPAGVYPVIYEYK